MESPQKKLKHLQRGLHFIIWHLSWDQRWAGEGEGVSKLAKNTMFAIRCSHLQN